jgi:hypothetical protein
MRSRYMRKKDKNGEKRRQVYRADPTCINSAPTELSLGF